MNWVVFGSSGHTTRPAGGALGNYWKCLPARSMHSRHIKTIVNTRFVDGPVGAHHFRYRCVLWPPPVGFYCRVLVMVAGWQGQYHHIIMINQCSAHCRPRFALQVFPALASPL